MESNRGWCKIEQSEEISRVKKIKRPPKRLCMCGCKGLVSPGKMFIWGHNNRGKTHPMYGKKHTEETLISMSIAKLGKNNPCYGRTGKAHPMYSRTGSKCPSYKESLHIRNLCGCGCGELAGEGNRFIHKHHLKGKNNPMYGREHSEKTRRRMSKVQKHKGNNAGENHPNWKGGISFEPYCCLWQDIEYKESIKERDGYRCQNSLCRNNSNRICIHHINYDKKDCRPINLITICFSCNARANYKRRFWQHHYEGIIIERIQKSANHRL